MDQPPLISIFKIFGVFSFKTNPKSGFYETSYGLQRYGKVITLLIQSFNLFSFIYRQKFVAKYFTKANITSKTSLLVIHFDALLWMALNISTVANIILRPKELCLLLNGELAANAISRKSESNKRLSEQHLTCVKNLWRGFLYPIVIFSAFNVWFTYGPTIVGYFTLFSQFWFWCQFLSGQFFELVILEKWMVHFKVLQCEVSRETVRVDMEMYSSWFKLIKMAVNLFHLNKFVCMVFAQMGISTYLFLYYEMMASGPRINYVRAMHYLLVLLVPLMVAHSWHRLTKEVRNFKFLNYLK